MTNKLIQYSGIALIAIFIAQGCKEKTNDPSPPNTPTTTPSTPSTPSSPSAPYVYKGMLVGSTGHITVTLTPKGATDSTKKGTGKVDMTMDGKKYTLTSGSDQLANFKKGNKLDTVAFSGDPGVTAEISIDKNGEIVAVKVTVPGHTQVTVAMFKEDDTNKDKIEVFEGIAKTYSGKKDSSGTTLLKEETFNLIIKGNKVRILRKPDLFTLNSCMKLEHHKKKHDSTLSAPPPVSEGTVKMEDKEYTFTFNKHGDQHNTNTFMATREGDKITGKALTIKNDVCHIIRKLDPKKAYDIAIRKRDGSTKTIKGYNIKKDGEISSSHVIFCNPSTGCFQMRKDSVAALPEIPAGGIPGLPGGIPGLPGGIPGLPGGIPKISGRISGTPVDKDKHEIPEGSSQYYKSSTMDGKGYTVWAATKTL